MTSLLYQIVKDLFEGADKRQIASFSAEQIERTINHIVTTRDSELKRLDIEEKMAHDQDYRSMANLQAIQDQGKPQLSSMFSRSILDSNPAAEEIEKLYEVRRDDVRNAAEFAIDILKLEVQKGVNFQPQLNAT